MASLPIDCYASCRLVGGTTCDGLSCPPCREYSPSTDVSAPRYSCWAYKEGSCDNLFGGPNQGIITDCYRATLPSPSPTPAPTTTLPSPSPTPSPPSPPPPSPAPTVEPTPQPTPPPTSSPSPSQVPPTPSSTSPPPSPHPAPTSPPSRPAIPPTPPVLSPSSPAAPSPSSPSSSSPSPTVANPSDVPGQVADPSKKDDSGGGLGQGAIVSIIAVSVLGTLVLVLLLLLFLRKRSSKRSAKRGEGGGRGETLPENTSSSKEITRAGTIGGAAGGGELLLALPMQERDDDKDLRFSSPTIPSTPSGHYRQLQGGGPAESAREEGEELSHRERGPSAGEGLGVSYRGSAVMRAIAPSSTSSVTLEDKIRELKSRSSTVNSLSGAERVELQPYSRIDSQQTIDIDTELFMRGGGGGGTAGRGERALELEAAEAPTTDGTGSEFIVDDELPGPLGTAGLRLSMAESMEI